MQLQRFFPTLLVLLGLALAGTAAAVPEAPGYDITFVELSGPAAGDVVVVDGALFVGVGPFGAGSQSLVRVDSAGETALASGFNALAGLAWNAARGSLIAADNAGDLPGAVSGDTLYEIPSPFASPTTPAVAADLELLPSGSLPGAADVVVDPADPTGATLYAADASALFPPAGRVLAIDAELGTTAAVVEGLAFSAGLAMDSEQLFVGEALLDFSGRVSVLDLLDPGAALRSLATLAGGQFDLELAPDGRLVATSGGAVLGIDPATGDTTELASGFGFAAGLFVDGSGTLFVIDGFAAAGEEGRVWVLTPVPEAERAVLMAGVTGLASALALRRRQSPSSA